MTPTRRRTIGSIEESGSTHPATDSLPRVAVTVVYRWSHSMRVDVVALIEVKTYTFDGTFGVQ